MNNSKHTNLEYLETTCGGSTDMMHAIIKMFIDSTPPILAEMRNNLMSRNWDALKSNAHKVKSSFMMIGALALGNKLQEIELSSVNGDELQLNSMLVIIESSMEAVIGELKTT